MMKPKRKTVVVGIRLLVDDLTTVKEIADRQKRPVASYLRLVIERDVEAKRRKAS